MSLRVWLPLNGTLDNQGLDNVVVTNSGATIDNNGKIGKCYSFDGSNDKIQISNAPTPTDISIAMWFKRNATTNTKQFLYTQWQGITLELEATNKMTCSVYSNGSQGGYCRTDDTITVNSGWIHICFVFKSGVGTKLYINGLLISSASLSTPITWGTTVGNIGYFSTYLNACINDFRIYDHALSPMEVKKISQGLVLHYPLNRNGWGQDNLHKNSDTITSTWSVNQGTVSNGIATITPSGGSDRRIYQMPANGGWSWESNKTYTTSIDARSSDGAILIFYPYGAGSMNKSYTVTSQWKRYSFTFTATQSGTGSMTYQVSQTSGVTLQLKHPKLELGEKATPWCPNPVDGIANSLNMNSNIEYDISGYKNNATRNNITYSLNSPKYQLSSVFNGSNSYIKVNENNWAIQGTDALTINFWAYSTDWTTRPKLISCTETGGWNNENGTAGHMRVPIYVYTNAEKTTKAYKYSNNEIDVTILDSGWHMFTIIYNLSGNRIYIDGQPHSNYNFVSYGICYNMSTRLFLGCEASSSGSPSTPYLNGNLSDFRIYNTVLSDDDIKELYESNKLG